MNFGLIPLILFFITSLFSNNIFTIENKSNISTTISFNIGEITLDVEDGAHKINTETEGRTEYIGEPDMPTYSFNYAVDKNKNYEIDYNVLDYETYYNIDLFPSQNKVQTNIFNKNLELYESDNIYPENNLIYDRVSLRGYELYSIQIVPFEYDFKNKILKVYTSLEINITENGYRSSSQEVPRSEVFEKLYNNFVINENDYEDSREFQNPSILYIMEDYNSLIETLVEWRRKQGYTVTVIDRDNISGSFNTSNIKEYIEDAYYDWEDPPEFVCLVGDANGSIAIPTFNVGGGSGWNSVYAESDYPYSLMDGDVLPEIIIGRMSVRSTSELSTVIQKIIGYEKNYSGDTGWLRAAALVGDPYDSGISTVITNQYIEEIMNIHGGITDIRTKYSGSNFDGFMRDQINDGVSFLNYRGFYGFSNFTTTDVNQLNNGFKLPFLMTLTCGTGSFEDDNTSIIESLFRAGTSVSPKGAVAVVGTAQSYTHTAFNNIVTMGMYEGIFIDRVSTVGESVVYGKLALSEIYPQNPNNNVYYFASWNNLMGDPATQLWTSTPKDLIVNHADQINQGSNNFQVYVAETDGVPYANAKVTLFKESNNNIDIHITAVTDESGIADFTLEDYSSGEVNVLTHCLNCLPVETNFTISNDNAELAIINNSIFINEQVGNNDGLLNPSETVELTFQIDNLSINPILDISVELTANSEYIFINNATAFVGDLSPAGTIDVSGLLFSVASNMSNLEDPELRVKLYSNNLFWQYIIPIQLYSGNLDIQIEILSDGNNNNQLDRGETATINFTADNIGLISLDGLIGQINYTGSFIVLSENVLQWNDINVGGSANSNSINILVNENVINGTIISIPISFTTTNGFEYNDVVQIQVGQVSINEPLGPDSYGYYIYHMNDNDYDLAPDYDWIEIDPDLGGDGQELNIYDSGNNGDDVTSIDLPFTFTFYGIDYNRLSVCSNGWISFGDTDMRSFRNYTLPGPGGPSPMVAVFWDDLKTTSGGEIYSFYDSQNDYFVIEWSGLRTYTNNSTESFQVILYNTGWQTHSGDDEIKLQYKDFNNTSVGDYPVGNYDGAVVHGQYCTVGIENHLQDDGLEYTFNNSYPEAAQSLSDYSALFISTRNAAMSAIPSLNYSDDSYSFDLEEGESVSDQLIISNDGEPGSVLYYNIGVSPFSSSAEQTDDFGYAWAQSNVDPNIDYDWIDISQDNTVLEFDDNDGGALISLGFNFPFYGNNYALCAVMANGWIGFDGTNEEWNNGSIFDDDSPRSAILAFWDDLNPASGDEGNGSGYVRYHSNSNRVVIWYDHVIHWTSLERIYDFQIVLYPTGEIDVNYRSMQGDTGSATVGIIDSQGEYGLEVIYNQNDFIQDEMSIIFNTAPTWLDLSVSGQGQIIEGESDIINLLLNSSSLSNGYYNSYIVISTNSLIGDLFIPVELNVGTLDLGDLNQDGIYNVLDIVTLVGIIMGNHFPSNLELILADLNSDGLIDVLDVVSLVNLVLSL